VKSGDMLADNPDQWMYHWHVVDHITDGMTSMYRVHEKWNIAKRLDISVNRDFCCNKLA
jgi:hypothetical protein